MLMDTDNCSASLGKAGTHKEKAQLGPECCILSVWSTVLGLQGRKSVPCYWAYKQPCWMKDKSFQATRKSAHRCGLFRKVLGMLVPGT